MDVFVYKKAVEEICKENIRRIIRPGMFICSDDCIFKKNGLCSGYPVTIVNAVDKINNKSVKIVHDWLHHESVTVE